MKFRDRVSVIASSHPPKLSLSRPHQGSIREVGWGGGWGFDAGASRDNIVPRIRVFLPVFTVSTLTTSQRRPLGRTHVCSLSQLQRAMQ